MLRLDLAKLEREGYAQVGAQVPADDPLWHGAEVKFEGPVDVHLRATHAGTGEIVVRGAVQGMLAQECRRCLTEVVTAARATFVMPMLYLASEEGLRLDEVSDDDEERLVFGRPEVDFAPLLAQLFAIELPLTALCREDCKGLSLDGVNLNEHPELQEADRARRDAASPFEALKDIDLTSQ